MTKGKTLFSGSALTRKRQIMAAFALAGLLIALILLLTVGRPGEASVAVLSLRRDVAAGATLAEDDLVQVRLPASLARDAYATTPASVVGQSPVHDLHAGQLLDRGWLRKQPLGIAYPDAAADARLYTLRLQPEQANGFWLAAGNRVDVHLVARGEAARQNSAIPEMLPAVRVAALIGHADDKGSQIPPLARTASETPLVCLSVSAAEARILALAEATCSIKLVPLNEPPDSHSVLPAD